MGVRSVGRRMGYLDFEETIVGCSPRYMCSWKSSGRNGNYPLIQRGLTLSGGIMRAWRWWTRLLRELREKNVPRRAAGGRRLVVRIIERLGVNRVERGGKVGLIWEGLWVGT
jgi:hypothetical protein